MVDKISHIASPWVEELRIFDAKDEELGGRNSQSPVLLLSRFLAPQMTFPPIHLWGAIVISIPIGKTETSFSRLK